MEENQPDKHIINIGSPETSVSPISTQLYSDELEERFQRDMQYDASKSKKIEKEYKKAGNKLRQVSDFLWDLVKNKGTGVITSYEDIANEVNTSENACKLAVSKLNFWEGHPFTWMPVPKKAGHIQNVLKNEDDYDMWNLKKEKTIVSMEKVKQKAKKITREKYKPKQKERRKIVRGRVLKND